MGEFPPDQLADQKRFLILKQWLMTRRKNSALFEKTSDFAQEVLARCSRGLSVPVYEHINEGHPAMPMPAYLTIEGETQGLISQGATTFDSITNEWQAGHEDEIMVQAFDHAVITPRDPQSGNPTGTRIHQPFKFTCTLNKAVPLMYNALVTGELLTNVELKWYRTQASEQVHFFTTQLEEALIVDINCAMPHAKDPATVDYTQLVDVKMTYRKIVWEHVVAGTSASDDWRAPVQA